jgi:hypothetical protein
MPEPTRQSSPKVKIEFQGVAYGLQSRARGDPPVAKSRLTVVKAVEESDKKKKFKVFSALPFSVTGTVDPAGAEVSGYVVNPSTRQNCPGKPNSKPDGTWTLKFDPLPKGDYDLIVTGTAKGAEPGENSSAIRVQPARNVMIDTPSDGACVLRTFDAQGTVENPGATVSGRLTSTTNPCLPPIEGQPPMQQAYPTWTLTFSGVADDNYNLRVDAPGEPSAQVNVDVKEACPSGDS